MAIIDEIKAAEARAQKIKDDAKAAARADGEMIETEARKKAAEMKSAAEAEAAAMRVKAEAEAAEMAAEAAAKSEKECKTILAAGRMRLDEAVELILKGASEL